MPKIVGTETLAATLAFAATSRPMTNKRTEKIPTLVVEQHEVGGQKMNWWMVNLKLDGEQCIGFGFSTKRDAENALSMHEYLLHEKWKLTNLGQGI